MAEIEKSSKKNRTAKSEVVPAAAPESNMTTDMAAQLSELVAAAQIEWQMAETGVDFAPEAEKSDEQVAAADEPETVSFEQEAAALDATPLEFIEAEQAVSIIESVLFSSDKPISVAVIKQIFKGTNVRSKDISEALELLASEYAGTRRGVTLEEINGGYQLRTKTDNADYLRRLAKTRPFKLSGPALEVLAIVAYKQPVIKSEVDEIRGVESGHLMRALMERGLVNFAGKSELPGKPMQYGTSRKFLEIFGLRNLRELPTLSEIDELIPEGIGAEEEKLETLSDLTGDLSHEIKGAYSEGEEELGKITNQLQQINVSSEFFEQEKVRQRLKRDQERAQDIRDAMAVNESVDDKDKKWLMRYEAKLQAEALGVLVSAETNARGADATGVEFENSGGVEGEIETEVLADAGGEDTLAESMLDNSDEESSEDLDALSPNHDAGNWEDDD